MLFVNVRYSMLSKSQIRYLRGLANTLKQNYQIGKYEISDTLIEMLSNALDKYELIRVSINRSVIEYKESFANELVESLHAELIQIIGGVIILYRKNLKDPKIKLPK